MNVNPKSNVSLSPSCATFRAFCSLLRQPRAELCALLHWTSQGAGPRRHGTAAVEMMDVVGTFMFVHDVACSLSAN